MVGTWWTRDAWAFDGRSCFKKMARGLVMFLYHVTIKARGWHVMDA